MFGTMDEHDLRNEILSLKRQLNATRNENNLLKVKVRKLQEEIIKKNKHIEALLHPKKTSNFHKVMSENGATIVLNCLESNSKLQKLLDDKNVQIKRLQGELQTTRLYSVNDNKRQTKNDPPKRTDATKSGRKKAPQQQKSNSLTPSLEGYCSELWSNCETSHPEQHCPRNSGSPESDLDRNELFCETPHKEIQQLHRYVVDVLSEVQALKETIAQMREENERTRAVLERKEGELQKLRGAKEGRRKGAVYAAERSSEGAMSKENSKKKMKASPRKSRKKKRPDAKENVSMLVSCIDSVETQVQRETKVESVGSEVESECEYVS